MKIESDGGQAFPGQDEHGNFFHSGMSLRDWFAGRAMQGLISNDPPAKVGMKSYAEEAYLMADEMLVQRQIIPQQNKEKVDVA